VSRIIQPGYANKNILQLLLAFMTFIKHRGTVEHAYIDSHPAKIINCSAMQVPSLRACRVQ